MEGGTESFLSNAKSLADATSPFYVLLSNQISWNGSIKYYIDFKIPQNWLPYCYDPLIVETFENSIKNKFQKSSYGKEDAHKFYDGLQCLEKIIDLTKHLYCSGKIEIDISLARGLSYYTGAVLEINVPDFAGSLAGGGRYDGLIGMFGKEQIPAVGFSIGLERILYVMEERGMFQKLIDDGKIKNDSADVMITIWNEETAGESLKLAGELRTQDLRVLVYPEADKLGKQFKYADSLNIPFVCILGETELAENKVALKNMKTGEQKTVERNTVSEKIKS